MSVSDHHFSSSTVPEQPAETSLHVPLKYDASLRIASITAGST
jgi:hypothetical protein